MKFLKKLAKAYFLGVLIGEYVDFMDRFCGDSFFIKIG